jgi:murein DD-endopeptidase MepM/ murein hydrolase activator NlpD
MRCWPVPDSYAKALPENGAPGSFWEDRGDRRHCGVDIYAPKGSVVRAVEDGDIAEVGVFTSPDMIRYWNVSYYVLIMHANGLIGKYAEMGDVVVSPGQSVKYGQLIGHVGAVLNSEMVTDQSPPYILRLKENGHPSMLHFELHRGSHVVPESYLGGNVFLQSRPDHLVDGTGYLRSALSCLVPSSPTRSEG